MTSMVTTSMVGKWSCRAYHRAPRSVRLASASVLSAKILTGSAMDETTDRELTLTAELKKAQTELERSKKDAEFFARKLKIAVLQAEINVAVVRRSMAITAQAQREMHAASTAQAQREMLVSSISQRLAGAFCQPIVTLKRFRRLLRREDDWTKKT